MNEPSLAVLEQAARQGDDGARLALAHRLLLEHPYGSFETEWARETLQALARGAHAPAASWVLGAWYLMHIIRPGAHAAAMRWLRAAAAADVGPAIDRLANQHLRGLLEPFEPDQAAELLNRLAAAGFQRAAWELGYLASAVDGDEHKAAERFARAAALGYPPGYYSLGLRFAQGAGVAKDGGFARALLLRAHDGKVPDARAAADELVPECEFGVAAATWYRKLKENYDAAADLRRQAIQQDIVIDRSKVAAVAHHNAHFAKLGHPAIECDAAGRLKLAGDSGISLKALPQNWEWIAEKPRVALAREFITREEGAILMFAAAGALIPAAEYRTATANGETEVLYFTGRGHNLGAMYSDAVTRLVERRISSWVPWPLAALEPSSVIRYLPHEEYRTHVDYFSPEQVAANPKAIGDFSGQRIVTFLICLKAPEAGGETRYDLTGVEVKYQDRVAVMHYNVTPDGAPDPLSAHCGRPVLKGEKWLLRTTLRERSRFVPED